MSPPKGFTASHNPKVAGSNPAPATREGRKRGPFSLVEAGSPLLVVPTGYQTALPKVRSPAADVAGPPDAGTEPLLCMESSTAWRDTAWAMSQENVEIVRRLY